MDDWKQSIELLSRGFHTWQRLQHEGLVRTQTLSQVAITENWEERYPDKFRLLHRGAREENSPVIGRGQYAIVYQLDLCAYKVVRLNRNRDEASRSLLRCCLKELAYFHSMQHPTVMHPMNSQIVMAHGTIKTVIHQMPRARFTLMDAIMKGELTCLQHLVYLFHQLAHALSYMHARDIVHGDLKPANILIGTDYQCFVSDFTITSFENRGTTFAFGTLWWRAPECLLNRDSSRQSDAWSLGMMLLDCLYGTTYMETVAKVHDNHSAWLALLKLLGDPPTTFIEAFVDDKHRQDLFVPRKPIQHPACRVHMTAREWVVTQQLVKQLLQWEPSQRLTMDQMLRHEFFQLLPAHRSPTRIEAPIRIVWRTRGEREHLIVRCRQWVRLQSKDEWLLREAIILAKRLMERMRVLNATFELDSVLKTAMETVLFLWQDYWPSPDDLFESQLYHVFTLLDFRIFSFAVLEEEWRGGTGGNLLLN
jgi:serine/threonine protein kinase